MRKYFLLCLLLVSLILAVEGPSNAAQEQEVAKRSVSNLYPDFSTGDSSRSGEGSDTGNDEEKCKVRISSPKQKASNIAQKAAQEAKAAHDAQEAAGKAASERVKMHYAEKAMQAAKAAEAALAGKQQIVDQLEQEVREAEAVVQEETISLQNAHQNVNAAMDAARQAQAQLRTLGQAVQIARANVQSAEQAASGSQQEVNEKASLVEAARNRVELLLRQLRAARLDLQNTRDAATRAVNAARAAKMNASRCRRMIVKKYLAQQRQ